MLRSFKIIAICLLLAACGTTEEVHDYLNKKYVGQPADDFFIHYGMPTGSMTLTDGRKLYRWSKGESSFTTPDVTNIQTSTFGTMTTATAVTTPGATFTFACELQILAGKNGKIESISIARDTSGFWRESWCNEGFIEDRSALETSKADASAAGKTESPKGNPATAHGK